LEKTKRSRRSARQESIRKTNMKKSKTREKLWEIKKKKKKKYRAEGRQGKKKEMRKSNKREGEVVKEEEKEVKYEVWRGGERRWRLRRGGGRTMD
jgi:hypothetical protein